MVKRLMAITLFLLLTLTPTIVIASDYMKCTIPKGTIGASNRGTIFIAFEDQVKKVKKHEGSSIVTFQLKGFINDCPVHGREPITKDAIGGVLEADLKDCIDYDWES